jgi:hypothetical protein
MSQNEWRQIMAAPDYEISDLGQIRRRSIQTARYYKKGKPIKILKPWLNSMGYQVVKLTVDGFPIRFMVHRLVCAAFHGESDLTVDHIDRNPLNNNAENLRWVSQGENNHNRLHKKSGYRGISMQRNKYAAYGSEGHRTIYLGKFETEEDAAKAYDNYASKKYGNLAIINGV